MNIKIEFNNVSNLDIAAIAEALKVLGQVNPGDVTSLSDVEVLEKPVKEKKTVVEEKKTAEKPKKEEVKKEDLKATSKHTLDELRDLAIKKSSAGLSEGVKAVLTKHSIERVTLTPAELIDAVYADIEVL